MFKGFAAILSVVLVSTVAMTDPAQADAAPAKDDGSAILNQVVNVPGVGAWNVWNAQAAQRKDETVQGGYALRVVVPKHDNPWEAAAIVTLKKPIKKGDAIQVAFWARAEVPPAGRDTAILAQIGVGLANAPYTGLFAEPATVGKTWKWYYAAGVADRDYKPGELNMSVQLAAAEQTVDLGPVFVLDLGPDYNRAKLIHNGPAAPLAAIPTAGETLAAAQAKIQASLPSKGVPMTDPASGVFAYGADQTNRKITTADVPGGIATRIEIAKTPANAWDVGASLPLTGDIRKGDTLNLIAYVRVTAPAAGSGSIAGLGISLGKAPWTRIIGADVAPKAGAWQMLTVSGISPVDAKSGEAGAGMMLGGAKQTVDIGPVFVFNLGQTGKPLGVKQTN